MGFHDEDWAQKVDSVESRLDRTLWALVRGDVGLESLTPALLAWWSVAFEAGRASMLPQLWQAEADRDRYWAHAFDTPERIRRRLDDAAREHWSAFLDSEARS